MNKKTLNKIINYFREEMTAANSPGTQGGFSSSADAKGPVAGYDKPMKTFIMFLGKLPEHPKSFISDIQVDIECLKQLQQTYNESKKA